ncbi:MAG: hypothetical protein M0P94_00280 [Candidatus Absconditabacterales bacterium]|nr:hypothetical protein [Candidatus Absconditabacterales bacterium]
MTDQNQNPNTANQNLNNESFDIFGGDNDIFENSAVLEPIKDVLDIEEGDELLEMENKTLSTDEQKGSIEDENTEASNEDYEYQEVIPEEPKEEQVIEKNPNDFSSSNDKIYDLDQNWNKEQETLKEDFENEVVDPFENIEEEKENVLDLDDNALKTEATAEITEGGDLEPDFENSPEIDALDEIDYLNEDKIPNFENEIVDPFENIEEEKEDVLDLDDNTLEVETTPEVDELEDLESGELENIEEEGDDIEEYKNIEEGSVEEKDIEKNIEDVANEEEIEYITDEEGIEEEEDIEEENVEDENVEIQEAHERETQVEIDKDATDLQKKFYELVRETKSVHELVDKDLSEGFDVLGGNDDRKKTMYKVFVGDNFASIDRTETFKTEEKEEINTLTFILENKSLQTRINDELLYDELEDLIEDQSKRSQVLEKINKFIFLITEEYKKIEKQKKEKEKKSIIKGIFRNF